MFGTATNPSTSLLDHTPSTLSSHQSRKATNLASYLLPHIKHDSKILDVGCGPGTITCDFASLAPQGHVIGIDSSGFAIKAADIGAGSLNLPNVKFEVASAHELPFQDESFDIVHCNALLVHVPDAVKVLREMKRVCRNGGHVGVREPDWGTWTVWPESEALWKWWEVHVKLKQGRGIEPRVGRRLKRWALDVGFDAEQVEVGCDALSYAEKEEVRRWGEMWRERVRGEMGKNAVKAGLASGEEVERWAKAYEEWSWREDALWSLGYVSVLCRK